MTQDGLVHWRTSIIRSSLISSRFLGFVAYMHVENNSSQAVQYRVRKPTNINWLQIPCIEAPFPPPSIYTYFLDDLPGASLTQ